MNQRKANNRTNVHCVGDAIVTKYLQQKIIMQKII